MVAVPLIFGLGQLSEPLLILGMLPLEMSYFGLQSFYIAVSSSSSSV